jgi:hypothetical protein
MSCNAEILIRTKYKYNLGMFQSAFFKCILISMFDKTTQSEQDYIIHANIF